MKAPSRPIHITFVRLSSLGDVIVAASVLPFIRSYLQETYPEGVKITWVVDSAFGEILLDSPCIDNLVYIHLKKGGIRAIPHAISILKSIEFCDKLIDMQGLIKSALCGAIPKKGEYWGFARDSIKEPIASICYSNKVHIPYEEHILKRNLVLLNSAFGMEHYNEDLFYANRALAFGVNKQSQAQIEVILREAFLGNDTVDNDFISVLLVLEASLESKSYPPDLFIEVINKLLSINPKMRILLLRHSTQKAQYVKNYFAKQERVVVLPILTMSLLKALMQKIDLLIGGDTGITHLAWAMQRSSLTLYGNTNPKRFALNSLYNHFLCGSENPSYRKDDFSIANISPNSICESVKKILDLMNKG